MSAEEVLTAQATDARLGLGAEEAQARLERYGRNELSAERPTPPGASSSSSSTMCS